MPTYSSDRRSLLKIIGAIGATCSYPYAGDELYAQASPPTHLHEGHAHDELPESKHYFFNETDLKTISVIAELIIPETDTPGAIAAGVPAYIDQAASRNTDFQLLISDGLRWLDSEAGARSAGNTFVNLNEQQQLSILQPLCDAYDAKSGRYARNVQFFSLIKNLTADGYYTSQIGLVQELGFQQEIRADYPACST